MNDDTPVLVADLGGTNIRFALADPVSTTPLRTDSIRRFRVAEFASLADAAQRYLDDSTAVVRRAVFAVAGRIDGDSVRITNHPWTIGIDATRRQLGLDTIELRNDFDAMSHSLLLLGAGDVHLVGNASAITVGARPTQTFAVIGPGTGLGVGALLRRGEQYHALSSEGGHVAFAPGTDEDIEVLRVLHRRFGRVSVERIVSGRGLVNLYQALCEIAGTAADDLTPEEITGRADSSTDDTCTRAVELCTELLGAIAGDLVLAFGAWDGVFLAGGLTPHLLPWLQRGHFRGRFEDKGRFADAMSRVPTQAILHADAGLLGAAAIAALAVGAPLGHGGAQSNPTRTPR
jgi:glucokinase